jgi:hypothetical protein
LVNLKVKVGALAAVVAKMSASANISSGDLQVFIVISPPGFSLDLRLFGCRI